MRWPPITFLSWIYPKKLTFWQRMLSLLLKSLCRNHRLLWVSPVLSLHWKHCMHLPTNRCTPKRNWISLWNYWLTTTTSTTETTSPNALVCFIVFNEEIVLVLVRWRKPKVRRVILFAATVVAALHQVHFVSHLLLSSSFPPPFLLLSSSFFFQGPRTLRASRRINKKRKTNQSSLEDLVLSSMMALDGESSVTSIYRHIQADLPTDTLSLDDFTQLDIRDLLVKNVDAFKLNKKKTAWCLVRSKKRKSL